MAWMVSVILIIFYVLGTRALHETRLIQVLPYVTILVLASDFLLARVFKRRTNKLP
jgi:hypothetical protein